MNIDDQVSSLELAKKLKELGVKQYSFSQWYVSDRSGYSFLVPPNYIVDSIDSYSQKYSAFTAAELLEILPSHILNMRPLKLIKTLANEFNVCYPDIISKVECFNFTDQNIANACAKLLIYLIENGLVKNEVS